MYIRADGSSRNMQEVMGMAHARDATRTYVTQADCGVSECSSI